MTESMLARWAVMAMAVTTLGGCGSISSSLGLERHVPDESQVVVRPALTLPPDYDLMPPGTGSPVSSDHENGLSKGGQEISSDAPQPKKEEGFFTRLFNLDFFGGDDKSPSSNTGPGPDINGTPVAPAPEPRTPSAQTAPADTSPGPDINGTPQAPAKSSSLDEKLEMPMAMALMVDPGQGQNLDKASPDYVHDFLSDMGSLVGIAPPPKKPAQPAVTSSQPPAVQQSAVQQPGDIQPVSMTQADNSAPVQPAPAQSPAARPVRNSPDYLHDFLSDMGSLVGLGGSQPGGTGSAAK